ncbi:MAG: PAS domain S-box protein [Bacteroidetes bacterium]|nr:PAS domain S-box protein [Bacteroidota bacterium]MCH8524408.1 PAS domain S-box protein [Balneolales bacterium]
MSEFNSPITFLTVEKDSASQELLPEILSPFFPSINIVSARSIEEVRINIKGKIRPDVVFADYELSDGSAADLISFCDEVPVIVALQDNNPAVAEELMKSGAFDYIVKSPNRSYLQILPYIVEKAVHKKRITDNEKLLSKVVTHIRDAVIVIDENLKIVFTNPAFSSIYGYSQDEVTGCSVSILLPDNQKDDISWQSHKGVEKRHRKKDGADLYVSEAISEISMHHGNDNFRIIVCRDITDRVQIEKSLAATTVRLDGVLSSIDDVVYSMDSKTREVFYVNKATEIVFNMSEDEFRQNTISWKKMVHGGDLYKLEVASMNLQKNGYAEAEYRLITPKGDIKWLRDRAWIVGDEGSSRIDGIITDVSERKFAEQAYRDSEERYRTAIQSSVEAIYMMNPANLAVTEVNEAFCNLLGYTRDEALQLKMTDFVDQHERRTTRYIEQVIEDGKSILDKRIWKTRDGRLLTVEITANKIVQRDQEIIFVVARDVTAQMEIERQLDNERQLLREVVANAPVPMAILDDQLKFLIFSRTWLQAYGPSKKSIQGKKLFEVYDMLPSSWEKLCIRGVDGEVLHIAEEELKLKNGEHIYLRLAIHPWGNVEGHRRGIILVAERIDELVNARKAAEEANKAKSGFLARITHELRTPLNAILGYSQIMSNDDDLAEVHKGYVDNMYRSGNYLLNMINDILDISKIEASKLELQHEPADLHEIIRDVVEMFKLKAGVKGIELLAEVNPAISQSVKIDRSKFSQVLINLIGNAVKFTQKGTVKLSINLDSTDSASTTEQLVTIEVKDSGRGIPPEDLHLIFEPFHQASNTDIQGTGLGLAITKRIINLMGGDITVASTLGEGSTFTFTVPIVKNLEELAKRVDRFTGVSSVRDPQPLNILVVDDVELNRTVARLILERVGATITEAKDGQEAVDIFKSGQFHAVVMDIIMPVMDGVKSMKTIRKTRKGKNVPIIALTASGFDDKRDALIQAGFDEYILKPFKEAELLKALYDHAGVEFNFKNKVISKTTINEEADATTICVTLVKSLPKTLRGELEELIAVQDIDEIEKFVQNNLRHTDYNKLAEILHKVTNDYDLYFLSNVSKRLSD